MGTRVISDGLPLLETEKLHPCYGWFKMKCLLCGAATHLRPDGPWRSALGCSACLGDWVENLAESMAWAGALAAGIVSRAA
jgi:hypothetical protein